jgi:hypothetical protein
MASIVIPDWMRPTPRPPQPPPLSPAEWALAKLDRLMSGQSNRGGPKDETPRY